jgi:hypothetical protein
MVDLQIIIPRPGDTRPDAPYRTPEQRWEEVVEAVYGTAALPTNVMFEHDPHYRDRVFTMQRAHDKSHWLWPGAWGLLIFSDLAWYFFRTIR